MVPLYPVNNYVLIEFEVYLPWRQLLLFNFVNKYYITTTWTLHNMFKYILHSELKWKPHQHNEHQSRLINVPINSQPHGLTNVFVDILVAIAKCPGVVLVFVNELSSLLYLFKLKWSNENVFILASPSPFHLTNVIADKVNKHGIVSLRAKL